MIVNSEKAHRQLVTRLRQRLAADTGGETVVIETHISSVILAGDYAYKIKKPVNFGFLDFSTLERRHFCCQEEIRLNARLAPQIYLNVVAITGSLQHPQLGGAGEPLEYAVRMRRFDQAGLLSTHTERLDVDLMDAIARQVARFHSGIAVAEAASVYGAPELLLQPMEHNFQSIRQLIDTATVLDRLAHLEEWTKTRQTDLWHDLLRRKKDGFIRECHGDLHLGNIALVDGEVLIFDGIEFNPDLRWIDTMSELAFLLMDLDEKGRPGLAARVLNSYLEVTGDFAGVKVLRFYQVYRAMVRAKVAAIRAGQAAEGSDGRQRFYDEFLDYLHLAERYTKADKPVLVLTHGLSGSGKSTLASALAGDLPALWLRSDVERKRLAGLEARDKSGSVLGGGIYTPAFTRRTYGRLLRLCTQLLATGFSVIVDATFLQREQRQPFYDLAAEGGYPLVVLDLQVPEADLQKRLRRREAQGKDASEADLGVLAKQLERFKPLASDELQYVVVVSPEAPDWKQQLTARLSIPDISAI